MTLSLPHHPITYVKDRLPLALIRVMGPRRQSSIILVVLVLQKDKTLLSVVS